LIVIWPTTEALHALKHVFLNPFEEYALQIE